MATVTKKTGHSQKNIAAVKRWWKAGKNVWEISQITGIKESLVMEIQREHC